MISQRLLLGTLMVCACFSAGGNYNWMDQGSWEGACNNGTMQSPINIDTKDVEFCPPMHWLRLEAPCREFNYAEEGRTLTTDAMDVNYLTYSMINWTTLTAHVAVYNSLQLHYHSPSEHTINGEHYDLEMHLVHTYMNNTGEIIPNKTEGLNLEVSQDP